MAKVGRREQAAQSLRISNDGSPAALDRVRKTLKGTDPYLIAAAAKLCAVSGYEALRDELVTTFDRLVGRGQLGDPNCQAKGAVLDALKVLGHDDPAVYLSRVRLFQYDPSWGKPEETAGIVRSIGALALVESSIPFEQLLCALGPLLFDASPRVRSDAVRALGACGRWEANLLIELKVIAGDSDPMVYGDCFVELLNYDASRYLGLVTPFIDSEDSDLRLQAACSLSESSNPQGTEALIESCGDQVETPDLEMRFLAVGRSRHDIALPFLLEQLQRGIGERRALALIAVLKGPQADRLAERMEAAVVSLADTDRDKSRLLKLIRTVCVGA